MSSGDTAAVLARDRLKRRGLFPALSPTGEKERNYRLNSALNFTTILLSCKATEFENLRFPGKKLNAEANLYGSSAAYWVERNRSCFLIQKALR